MISSARELFLQRLRTMLWIEETLAEQTLPRLRGLVHANDLVRAVERHQLETEAHVRNLGRIFVLVGERAAADESVAFRGLEAEADRLLGTVAGDGIGDLAALEAIAQTEHLELAGYVALEHFAQALAVDRDVVYLLRTNMEQDAFALEQAEHALAKLLAEKVENAR